MRYSISGDIAQTVRLEPEPEETVWVSKRSLIAYSRGVEWTLKVPGGLEGAVRRTFAGEGVALTHLTVTGSGEHAVIGANSPGHVQVWDLADGAVVTTKGSFLGAWGEDIDIDVTVARRAGAAFFGGAGLFLQKVSGNGQVLIHGAGGFLEQNLADGEEITVNTGNLAGFAQSVEYYIQGVTGLRRVFFGGEGLFMTRLKGPGRVLLQTLKRRKQRAGQ